MCASGADRFVKTNMDEVLPEVVEHEFLHG
jgi:hypothetical protein